MLEITPASQGFISSWELGLGNIADHRSNCPRNIFGSPERKKEKRKEKKKERVKETIKERGKKREHERNCKQ